MRTGFVVVVTLALAALMTASCQRAAEVPVAEPTACVAPHPPADAPAPTAAAAAEPSRVVVSYFHRTIRCETCIKFEALTDRVLREAFADELTDGRVEWRVTDFEEPGHEAEVARYDVFESSLVVSRFVGDTEVEWKKLDAIWNLVADEQLFLQYVQGEVVACLNAPRSDQ